MRRLLVVSLLLSLPCFAQEQGAKIFLDKCTVCHSIGAGERAGPDLVIESQRTDAEVRAAVHRMETNVGTLTVDEVEALVTLLKSPKAKELVTETPPVAAVPVPPRGDADVGRRLFYGQLRFQNKGVACYACHAVAGQGGDLAINLTRAHTQFGQSAILAAATQPVIPVMKAAYAKHPITDDEAFHLDAFLADSGDATQLPESTHATDRAAAVIALVLVGGIGIGLRQRRGKGGRS